LRNLSGGSILFYINQWSILDDTVSTVINVSKLKTSAAFCFVTHYLKKNYDILKSKTSKNKKHQQKSKSKLKFYTKVYS